MSVFHVETVLVVLLYLPTQVLVGQPTDVHVHRVFMDKIVIHVSRLVDSSFDIDFLH